ncbi:MAG: homoserine kinase [Microgenomates bacterium 39_7]|nr:MAG: homoserine kinase [Microgenomates bacterium 39_7]
MNKKPLFSPHFAKRLNLNQEEMLELINKVLSAYQLGQLVEAEGIEVGYENVNIILKTTSGKYLLKILIDFILKKPRSLVDSRRYIETMESFRANGIPVPRLYPVLASSLNRDEVMDTYLFKQQVPHNPEPVWMLVMEFFEGLDFIEQPPSLDDIRTVAKYLAIINSSKLVRQPVYDPWQPHYLMRSYEESVDILKEPAKSLIDDILHKFKNIDQEKLPTSVIHADFMRNNLLKNTQGKYCLLDFGVVNAGPRISDLAVFLAGFCMDPNDALDKNRLAYEAGLAAYDQAIHLSDYEKKHLGTMVDAAYACFHLPALYEKIVEDNQTEENEYWVQMGEAGLVMTKKMGL